MSFQAHLLLHATRMHHVLAQHGRDGQRCGLSSNRRGRQRSLLLELPANTAMPVYSVLSTQSRRRGINCLAVPLGQV